MPPNIGKNMKELAAYLRRSAQYVSDSTAISLRNDLGWQEQKSLFSFRTADDLNKWIIGSDADIGGLSCAYFSLHRTPQSTSSTQSTFSTPSDNGTTLQESYATFRGTLSTEVPPGTRLQQSGYAAIRSRKNPITLFHVPMHDCSLFRYLALRVRIPPSSPIRQFMCNIQTDGMIYPTYLYQHPFTITQRGKWETIKLPFREFTLTAFGYVQKRQLMMDTERIKTVGISVARQSGDFHLDIQWIKAWNDEYTLGEFDLIRSMKVQARIERMERRVGDWERGGMPLNEEEQKEWEEVKKMKEEMEEEKKRLWHENRIRLFDEPAKTSETLESAVNTKEEDRRR